MSSVSVAPGQSLYDIAVQHAGSAEAVFGIAAANGLAVTDALTPGQVLQVPEVADKRVRRIMQEYQPASENQGDDATVMGWIVQRSDTTRRSGDVIVRPGQSIWDIALQYAGSMEAAWEIARLNGLTVTTTLTPGQVLIMPPGVDTSLIRFFATGGYVPASDDTILEGIDYWMVALEFEVQ